jgi:hypothetical protein
LPQRFFSKRGLGRNLGANAQSRGELFRADPGFVDPARSVDSAAWDATLEFDHPLNGVAPGARVLFRGVIDSYMKEPYMLRLRVDDDVHGLEIHP